MFRFYPYSSQLEGRVTMYDPLIATDRISTPAKYASFDVTRQCSFTHPMGEPTAEAIIN